MLSPLICWPRPSRPSHRAPILTAELSPFLTPLMISPASCPDSLSAPPIRLRYVCTIAFVAAMGGLLFGYDWVVIGGAKPFFEAWFAVENPALSGWINSCALIGCLGGAVLAGTLSDRWGRKRLLLAAALIFGATSLGNAAAGSLTAFIAWRILGGVAIGLASNLSPMYISEIAPAGLRGRLVSINQLTIVIGILLAQFINWFIVRHLPAGADAAFIRSTWYGQTAWRLMFGLTALPSALFFFGMIFMPESPRWLIKQGRSAAARPTLERIGGRDYAGAEAGAIEASLAQESRAPARWRDLADPKLRRVLVLGVTLAVFQQWCGINVIFNYAQEIFRAAGYDIASVLQNIAWTGSVNFLFTLLAFRMVDSRGRRPLLLLGAAALAIIYTAIGCGYHWHVVGRPTLLLVLSAIACYAMSLAPVTWVVIAEIFPNRIRGLAMSVAVTALWLACFILTYTFPLLVKALGPDGTFWLYAVICGLGFGFLLRRLPETKGRSLEQLQIELSL
jgi:sugar porter (SP) family MFS transporter